MISFAMVVDLKRNKETYFFLISEPVEKGVELMVCGISSHYEPS